MGDAEGNGCQDKKPETKRSVLAVLKFILKIGDPPAKEDEEGNKKGNRKGDKKGDKKEDKPNFFDAFGKLVLLPLIPAAVIAGYMTRTVMTIQEYFSHPLCKCNYPILIVLIVWFTTIILSLGGGVFCARLVATRHPAGVILGIIGFLLVILAWSWPWILIQWCSCQYVVSY